MPMMSSSLLERMSEGPLPDTLRVKVSEGDVFVIEYADTKRRGG